MAKMDWTLDSQLQHDTSPVGDLPLCSVLAIDDADYPRLILVPRRDGIGEIAELDGGDAARLMDEIQHASRALKHITRCDKLNIAAIGNIVPQLHIHIVARRRDDPLWPKPIWGVAPPRPGNAAGFARFVAAIRGGLGLAAVG